MIKRLLKILLYVLFVPIILVSYLTIAFAMLVYQPIYYVLTGKFNEDLFWDMFFKVVYSVNDLIDKIK